MCNLPLLYGNIILKRIRGQGSADFLLHVYIKESKKDDLLSQTTAWIASVWECFLCWFRSLTPKIYDLLFESRF